MTHHVYTTEGIILRLRPSGESDKIVYIFTRELGLIVALARGLRKESSRLRTSLILFAKVRVSIVRGRGSWRVTTASLIKDHVAKLRPSRESIEALHRAFALVASLLHGEEKNQKLYQELDESLRLLFVTEDIRDWELFTVVKILAPLGYLAESDTPASLDAVTKSRKQYLALVNERLQVSGLYRV